MSRSKIALTLGDVNGIGPDIAAKVWQRLEKDFPADVVLVGDYGQFLRACRTVGVDACPMVSIDAEVTENGDGSVVFLDLADVDPHQVTVGQGSIVGANAAVSALFKAVELAEEGVVQAVVYGPMQKESLFAAGYRAKDDLQLLSDRLGWTGWCGEINVVGPLWTARVTSHIPLRDVASSLSVDGIIETARNLWEVMAKAGVEKRRIVVAALNPHGGDGGLFGDEEIKIITPAVARLKEEGIDVTGPVPADALFLRAFAGEFNGVVAMYHDQTQIATKTWSNRVGATYLAGLPFPLITPAHGTALDLAGSGRADEEPLWFSLNLAASLASRSH